MEKTWMLGLNGEGGFRDEVSRDIKYFFLYYTIFSNTDKPLEALYAAEKGDWVGVNGARALRYFFSLLYIF